MADKMALIAIERRAPVAILTLNRPEAMNPLGRPGDGDEFKSVCEELNRDASLRCVVLTGAGKAFSAGGDVKAMKERSGPFAGSAMELREMYRRNIHAIVRAVFGLDMPVVAAVNGPAIGLGCDVACLADIRIASDKAVFGATFLKLGLVPGDGGAWVLPRVIGQSRANELLFTAKTIDAPTAAQWGLVSRVVPHETLMDEALALAGTVAAQPQHALRLTKSLLRQAQTASLDAVLELSAASQALSHLTEDHLEGVNALLDKRPPLFKGR